MHVVSRVDSKFNSVCFFFSFHLKIIIFIWISKRERGRKIDWFLLIICWRTIITIHWLWLWSAFVLIHFGHSLIIVIIWLARVFSDRNISHILYHNWNVLMRTKAEMEKEPDRMKAKKNWAEQCSCGSTWQLANINVINQ